MPVGAGQELRRPWVQFRTVHDGETCSGCTGALEINTVWSGRQARNHMHGTNQASARERKRGGSGLS